MRIAVAADRRRHILDGDAAGGGHRAGASSAKAAVPVDWDDDRIIAAIESVANDPASSRILAARGRSFVYGLGDGISIAVLVGADGHSIVTAFPAVTG